jgi:hypothetical protein
VPALRAAGGGSVVLVSSINGERGKAGRGRQVIAFFHHEGFQLAPRLCLDLDLASTRRS